MAAPADFLGAGVLRITFRGGPSLTMTLSKSYHAADSCFVTVDAATDNDSSTLLVTLHPKSDALRLESVEVSWPGAVPLGEGTRCYRQASVRTSTGEELQVASLDEATAFTHLTAGVSATVLDRAYGGREVSHSLPILEIRAAGTPPLRRSGIVLQDEAAQQVLRLEPGFLDLRPDVQSSLLGASWVPDLGIATAWLDLPLAQGFQGRVGTLKEELAAFAKTCHRTGLRAGISYTPFLWTAAGVSRHRASQAAPTPPPKYTGGTPSWEPNLGQFAHRVGAWTDEAEASLVQGVLSLQDLGFAFVNARGLDTLGHPDRPVIGGDAERLSRGLALLTGACPELHIVTADLPAAYLEDWPIELLRPGVSAGAVGSTPVGFWRKPIIPGLPPRYCARDWAAIYPNFSTLHDPGGSPDPRTAPPPIRSVYEIPIPAAAELSSVRAGHGLPATYWRSLEVALQRQLP